MQEWMRSPLSTKLGQWYSDSRIISACVLKHAAAREVCKYAPPPKLSEFAISLHGVDIK